MLHNSRRIKESTRKRPLLTLYTKYGWGGGLRDPAATSQVWALRSRSKREKKNRRIKHHTTNTNPQRKTAQTAQPSDTTKPTQSWVASYEVRLISSDPRQLTTQCAGTGIRSADRVAPKYGWDYVATESGWGWHEIHNQIQRKKKTNLSIRHNQPHSNFVAYCFRTHQQRHLPTHKASLTA